MQVARSPSNCALARLIVRYTVATRIVTDLTDGLGASINHTGQTSLAIINPHGDQASTITIPATHINWKKTRRDVKKFGTGMYVCGVAVSMGGGIYGCGGAIIIWGTTGKRFDKPSGRSVKGAAGNIKRWWKGRRK